MGEVLVDIESQNFFEISEEMGMTCLLYKKSEPRATRNTECVICNRCTTRLMLATPAQKGKLYEDYIASGMQEEAEVLRRNFVIGKLEVQPDLVEAIPRKGIRSVSKLTGVSHEAVRKWLKNRTIPRGYVESVIIGVDWLGV